MHTPNALHRERDDLRIAALARAMARGQRDDAGGRGRYRENSIAADRLCSVWTCQRDARVPALAAVRRETGLARAKPLLAPAGTWPASSPSFLRVPIDDLFVSEGVRVVSWEVIGAETNSDHAPVLVTIDLPEPEPGTPAD